MIKQSSIIVDECRVLLNKSILLNLVGDLVAPLINQNALRANYYGANARQNQAIF